MKKILFQDRDAWRAWLAKNHAKTNEIWLIYYKKHTKKQSVGQSEAVEEALCFGWIDSIVKTIDDERYSQKFTPRKEKSNWSKTNKDRVKKLQRQKKMTKAGMAKVEAAKKNGSWNRLDKIEAGTQIPPDLEKALKPNKAARENFARMAPSHRKQYIYWIESAKREQTRMNRILETVERVAAGRKPGY